MIFSNTRFRTLYWALLLTLVLAWATPARAQFGQTETAKIIPPPEYQHPMSFGTRLTAAGERLAVGFGHDGPFVYRYDGADWTLEAVLRPNEIAPEYGTGPGALGVAFTTDGEQLIFGGAIAGMPGINGAYAVTYTGSGPFNGWQLDGVLMPSMAEPESYLGRTVAIGGEPGTEIVVLGGYAASDNPEERRSAAHVFRRDPATGEWVEEGRLWPEGVDHADLFGASVAALGDMLLVGAPQTDWTCVPAQELCHRGAAYLFRRTENADGNGIWIEETRWTNPVDYSVSPPIEGIAGRFGHGVALSPAEGVDGVSAIAAIGGNNAGLVVTIEWQNGEWAPTDTLDTEKGSNFHIQYGVELDPSGTRLVVGGAGWNRPPYDVSVGLVQIFTRGTDGRWTLTGTRLASDGANGDRLGVDVAYADGVIVAGAPRNSNEAGSSAGAVYVFGEPVVSSEPEAVRERARLAPAFPNPARYQAEFTLRMPEPGSVEVALYDVLGRQVAVLHDGPLAPGEHFLSIDTSRLASGVYVVRAAGEGFSESKRITVAR